VPDASTDALIRRLTEAIEQAGRGAGIDLGEIDSLLEDLRGRYRNATPDDAAGIAARVRPLRARRDLLVTRRSAPDGADPSTGPPRSGSVSQGVLSVDDAISRLGVDALRPGQGEAIEAAITGRDALVVMATGSGKSLCYQVPALALDGLTIVVSPLIALIRDQYERMVAAGAPVCMLTSNQTNDETGRALAAIAGGGVRVVFCAPERFSHGSFLQAVARNRVDLFVVDEAHCLVEWGDNFRPEYARLAEWRDEVGATATLALTATATPEVGSEIVRRLRMRDPLVLTTGFDRPNLSFDVVTLGGRGAVARKWDYLMEVVGGQDALPAIIYCGTRKETGDVADGLVARGLRAAPYHARLDPSERTTTQTGFMDGDLDVICATNAFGMGVDKADVRAVVHWSLPRSLEGYYQEAGRAGRDGKPARAVLLAMNADRGRLIFFNKKTLAVEDVDRLLGQIHGRADSDGRVEVSLEDVGGDDATRLSFAAAQRVGAIDVTPWASGVSDVTIRAAHLSPSQRDEVNMILREARNRNWDQYRAIVGFVDQTECRRAAIMHHFGDHSQLRDPLGRCCDRCNPVPPPAHHGAPDGSRADRVAPSASSDDPLDADQAQTFEVLRGWRRDRADGKPAYTVCPDAVLREIVRSPPTTRAELAGMRGIGPGFMDKHADDLLMTIGSVAPSSTRGAPG
jgi:ATP-dependent DNA helicase RecQ